MPTALAIAVLLGCSSQNETGQDEAQPDGEWDRSAGPPYNVVVVLSDALRAASLPMYGYPRDTAPFLSGLADESIVFEQHLANYPGTPISVSQLFTGRLMPPLLMGFRYALAPVRALDDELLVLPGVLRAAGYRTGIVTSHPWFDATARVLDDFDEQFLIEPEDGYPYATFEDLAPSVDAFLEQRAEDSGTFFLYIHAMDTHSPHRRHRRHPGPPDDPGLPPKYDLYDGEIVYTDYWTEQVFDKLEKRGLLASTIFVFTSDHGEEFNELGAGWWNRSHGATVRRAQVHVPLLIRMPGSLHAGLRFRGLSRHIDFAPTLLKLALPERPIDAGYRVDGVDLLAGDPEAGSPVDESLAYSWRHWGLHHEDEEWIYDQWEDRFSAYRIEKTEFNYPLPRPSAATSGSETEHLAMESERRVNEFLNAEPSQSHMSDAIIGLPTRVVEAGGEGPTFDKVADDDRWFLKVGQLLAAAPGERPGSLTLSTPWAPGEYHVWVRLHRPLLDRGYRNRLEIELLGGGLEGIEVDGEKADSSGRFDLGIHVIDRSLEVRFSDPRGGVAITGFELRLIGADSEELLLDDDLEERLRALGYVQ